MIRKLRLMGGSLLFEWYCEVFAGYIDFASIEGGVKVASVVSTVNSGTVALKPAVPVSIGLLLTSLEVTYLAVDSGN